MPPRCALQQQTMRAHRFHGPGARPLGRAVHVNRDRVVRCPAAEVDPNTGTALEYPEARASVPTLSVKAGSLNWAYRKAGPKGSVSTPPVLLLHGIASSSYSYRELLVLLAEAGYNCFAPDLPGHGYTDKPTSGFDYSEAAYVSALDDFTSAIGLKTPFIVITHGFVLGQYGLLWALKQKANVAYMVILNTPLGRDTSLRPELAAYKNPLPFLRPKPDAKFAADIYNAQGLAYEIRYDDTQVYDRPYQEQPEANEALYKTMDKLDWPGLLAKVDEGYRTWKVPTAVLYGNKDPFLDVRQAMSFLETKRTSMLLASVEGILGHMPQEDFAAGFSDLLESFFAGGDISVKGIKKFKKDKVSGIKGETGNF